MEAARLLCFLMSVVRRSDGISQWLPYVGMVSTATTGGERPVRFGGEIVGNSLRIRHSEATQEMIDRSELLDWLFVRMFSFVRLLLLGSGRSA